MKHIDTSYQSLLIAMVTDLVFELLFLSMLTIIYNPTFFESLLIFMLITLTIVIQKVVYSTTYDYTADGFPTKCTTVSQSFWIFYVSL